MSYVEDKVAEKLRQYKVYYEREYSFAGCRGNYQPLRFDFALFHNNGVLAALIEVQGAQHYEPVYGQAVLDQQQEYDQRKKEYCKQHNIPLLYFWYSDRMPEKAAWAKFKNFVNKHLPELNIKPKTERKPRMPRVPREQKIDNSRKLF